MENISKYKGQTEGVILFLLQEESLHVDEIKYLIDESFSGVKIGTLYSVLTRLKTNKLLSEYRASSIDGSRRKYYKITADGLKLFNAKYKELFEGVKLPKKPSIVEETAPLENKQAESNKSVEEETPFNYGDYSNNVLTDTNDDIDFSSLNSPISNEKEEKPTETVVDESSSQFISYDYSNDITYEDTNTAREYDDDSVVNSSYEYSSVLNKLFPKKTEIFEENQQNNNDLEEDTAESKQNNYSSLVDLNDVYKFAEKEGITIRTSADTNRYQGSKILVNRLLLFTSIFVTLFAFIEYFLMTLIIPPVTFDKQQFLTISIIFGIVLLSTAVIFVLNPNYSTKNLPRFVNLIEIAIILTISVIIISFALSAIKEINYSNSVELFANLILPSVIATNLPIFVLTLYGLSKIEFFQTI